MLGKRMGLNRSGITPRERIAVQVFFPGFTHLTAYWFRYGVNHFQSHFFQVQQSQVFFAHPFPGEIRQNPGAPRFAHLPSSFRTAQ